ncbi:hypothetical protein EBB79_19860 [Parasedimentitalea marina]|uniref:Uncharacterized protein n=1 Tax=Parasedimentitalea marina TaxID=2483033 RepID=A0A3T0N790_9RHOB|nr:hypothetical protein [Parasedimentitalea marina]AZV79914.1 hypothetical protein EBB79_19860 [Parasedimentitalea marina]
MQQYETPEVKCRPDGSIDTAHYIKIGRQERADQARALAKAAIPKRRILSLPFWFLRTSGT